MNYWQGKKVRLRSIEPGDGPFLFELSRDTDTRMRLSATVDLLESVKENADEPTQGATWIHSSIGRSEKNT